MAGDWIKMRVDLQSHPKVVRILSALCADKFRVIGGLHAVWAVFDTHCEDGILVGYTPSALDHIVGWEGFAQAMLDVGWLEVVNGDSLQVPEFKEHNGQSAKRRAEDQKRKRDDRKRPQSVRNPSANNEDKKRTRDRERDREDKKNTNGDDYAAEFAEFWESYPRKDNKAAAYRAWKKLTKPCRLLAAADVASRVWGDAKFVPHAATYLNNRRWEDSPAEPQSSSAVGYWK